MAANGSKKAIDALLARIDALEAKVAELSAHQCVHYFFPQVYPNTEPSRPYPWTNPVITGPAPVPNTTTGITWDSVGGLTCGGNTANGR